jgi:hypothetical protein
VTEPPATDPPVTDPPATDPAPVDEVVTVAQGLLSVAVPEGWDVIERLDAVKQYFGAGELGNFVDDVDSLVVIERGAVTVGFIREGLFEPVPGVGQWTDAVVNALGVQINLSEPGGFAGGDGRTVRAELPSGDFIRFDSTEIDGHYFAAIAFSADPPTDELDAEVSALLETVIIDTSVVPPLAHALEVLAEADSETTGSTPWEMSILVPADWEEVDDEIQWFDPDGDGFAQFKPVLADADFATMAANELEIAGNEWLDVAPTIEPRVADDVPIEIYWEGDPADATAAIVMSHDGVVFASLYLFAPDDPALLTAMVDSTALFVSAAHPEGV